MSSRLVVDAVEAYLTERRQLGYALKIEAQQLRSFARFADAVGHRGPLTVDLVVRWATLPSARTRHFPQRRLAVVRPFARYLAAIDGFSEVPPDHLLGPLRRRPMHHIYSDQQLAALLDALGQLQPVGGLRPRTYTTLFGLLIATGLRISEALRLARKDVDLDRGLLVIRETKFRKTRLVPLHPTTVTALRIYAAKRDGRRLAANASAFFVTVTGSPLCYSTVRHVFQRVRRRLGWSELTPRPRIHDLRHTFACRRLQQWYADGADVPVKVAALATYLGHAHVTDTYWYLTGTPELLAVAAARFESCATDIAGTERRP
jgi:integrase